MMEGQLIDDFLRIKETKNKLTSPSQTFPIALNSEKAGNKAEKVDMC